MSDTHYIQYLEDFNYQENGKLCCYPGYKMPSTATFFWRKNASCWIYNFRERGALKAGAVYPEQLHDDARIYWDLWHDLDLDPGELDTLTAHDFDPTQYPTQR